MTLLELFHLLRQHLKLVIILPVVCAVVTAAVAWGLMPNTYTASTSVYVLTRSQNTNGNSAYSDLSASQMLTNDVAALIKSDRIESETANNLGLGDLRSYKVNVDSSTTTRVITVEVTGANAQTAADVANGLAASVDRVAREVMDVQSINVIDQATAPSSPSGPSRLMYTAVAFLAGLFVAIVIVVLMDMMNTRVRSADEVEELIGVPVIGRIPVIKD